MPNPNPVIQPTHTNVMTNTNDQYLNEIKVLSVLKINEMDKFLPLLLEMVRWENTVEEGVDKLTKGMVVANTEGAS